jgi:alpha/beta hydrolase fold
MTSTKLAPTASCPSQTSAGSGVATFRSSGFMTIGTPVSLKRAAIDMGTSQKWMRERSPMSHPKPTNASQARPTKVENRCSRPVRGNLADLPPVILHVGEAEILLDDARQYADRAEQAGSVAIFHVWQGMVHAFQLTLPCYKRRARRSSASASSCGTILPIKAHHRSSNDQSKGADGNCQFPGIRSNDALAAFLLQQSSSSGRSRGFCESHATGVTR